MTPLLDIFYERYPDIKHQKNVLLLPHSGPLEPTKCSAENRKDASENPETIFEY